MPRRGLEKQRDFTVEEKAEMGEGTAQLGVSSEDLLALWGESALDIYLNNETYWSNVPEEVPAALRLRWSSRRSSGGNLIRGFRFSRTRVSGEHVIY